MKCYQCPRKCGKDREIEAGLCGEKQDIRIAKIISNFKWEEPPISGEKGTFAIFFSGCNLRCEYCQNYEISCGGRGKTYSVSEFADLLKKADQTDNETIELITPSHFLVNIIKAFKIYFPKKPVVYNTSSYELDTLIEQISPYISIFLPDLKYFSKELSQKFSKASDYFDVAMKAIITMQKFKPNKFENGKMTSGVIVRHLVLPGQARDSFKMLDNLKAALGDPVVSLMSQFTPNGKSKDLDRKLYQLEYKSVLSHLKKIGIEKGFYQDGESADVCFKPNFD